MADEPTMRQRGYLCNAYRAFHRDGPKGICVIPHVTGQALARRGLAVSVGHRAYGRFRITPAGINKIRELGLAEG